MELDDLQTGSSTILINVGGIAPLVITGVILREPCNDHGRKGNLPYFPHKIEVEGEIAKEENFLIVNVTSAIIPVGFPIAVVSLLGEIAINIDYVILVLPVAVV